MKCELSEQYPCWTLFVRGGWSGKASGQMPLPSPRFGFYGVIDERLDFALLDPVAASRTG